MSSPSDSEILDWYLITFTLLGSVIIWLVLSPFGFIEDWMTFLIYKPGSIPMWFVVVCIITAASGLWLDRRHQIGINRWIILIAVLIALPILFLERVEASGTLYAEIGFAGSLVLVAGMVGAVYGLLVTYYLLDLVKNALLYKLLHPAKDKMILAWQEGNRHRVAWWALGLILLVAMLFLLEVVL